MAIDTGNSWIMDGAMAFRTEHVDVRAHQEETIRRPMGNVADGASFGFHGQVFINKGPAFLRVALEARFVLNRRAGPSQACPFTASMGGVAIRTFHCPLEHLVRVGQIERRFYILVAGEAEIGLFLLQEFFAHPSPVDLVAIVTSDGAEFMNRSSELREVFLLLVALQAGVGVGFGIVPFEREDEPLPLCLRVL